MGGRCTGVASRVTGVATLNVNEVCDRAMPIKIITELSVSVGFDTDDTAVAISQVADGVIAGAILVKTLDAKESPVLSCKAVTG